MQGVSIVETATLQALIFKVENLQETVMQTLADINEAKKPYLTLKEAGVLLNKSEKWMHTNKHEIGCSKTGGDWTFKRKDIEAYINQSYFKNTP
ncbi:hypothetical protein DBR40_21895 [Pedobacter sp. KBW01]|uniref:helix-turn-helix domain-containing protein n=1 Tax=Pedobacter sp. KBW01 TaxID=2153364 RepID=UPI000F5AE53B|nr:helix-turn-helix domain-containing protein [Pedobacter sp. KBW01]RQO66806.1 hypothetical protein DBR40_21895 [Pedobacter sp. KBW01]